MGSQHIGIFPLKHFVGKLLPDLMGLFRRGLAGSKGLYQVVGQIVALLVRLRQQHFKFYVCCFIGAGKGGHQQLIVGLVRVFDVVQGFFQRCLDRMYLCNCHIFASAPLMSSMSCAYTGPMLFSRFAI